jgi:hypothetical protein
VGCTVDAHADNWFEDRIQAAEDEESHQEHSRETREHSLNVLVGFGNVSQVGNLLWSRGYVKIKINK